MFGSYFCGNKISEYGRKNGFVDYATFAKAFDAVLNNEIMEATMEIGYWEKVNGDIDNCDEIDEIDERLDELNERLDELIDKRDELEIDKEEAEDEQDRAEYAEQYDEIEKQIDALQNEIAKNEQTRDELEDEQDNEPEVFQWFIVSDRGAEIIQSYTNEQLYYNESLDMYLWGVTHWGTSWDYVLTEIPCKPDEDEEARG